MSDAADWAINNWRARAEKAEARVAELEGARDNRYQVGYVNGYRKGIADYGGRVAELEGVLRPFAALADHAEQAGLQDDRCVLYTMLGPCRRGRAVLYAPATAAQSPAGAVGRDLVYKALDGFAAPDECDEILRVLDEAGYFIGTKAQSPAGADTARFFQPRAKGTTTPTGGRAP